MGGGALEGIMGGAVPGAAAAGGANVNPLMAGLMGGAVPGMAAGKGMMPPIPDKNELFHPTAGQANAAKAIKDSPAAMAAMSGLMSRPQGPGNQSPPPPADVTGQSSMPAMSGGQGGDSGGSFNAKPWKNETVFGNDVTGQNWKPSRGSIQLPETARPLPDTTPSTTPMPERNPNFHTMPAPAMAGGAQGFDTSAPKPPASAQAAGAARPVAPGLFEQMTGQKIPGLDTAQAAMKGVPTNPLVQTGLGLLASGYDGSNPYTNIASNLKGIQGHEIALRSADIADAAEGRKKKDAADEAKDAELRALIAQMMMSGMPGAAGAAAGQGVASSQGQARLVR